MSSTAGGSVATVSTIQLPDNASPTPDPPQTLFTVPLATAARIETVAMFIDYAGQTSSGDIYVVSLVDQSGVVLYTQPTPVLNGVDATANFVLTWARGANDTAQLAQFQTEASGFAPTIGWCVMPLPDLYLSANSMVNFSAYRGNNGDEAQPVTVDQIVVTYTPGVATNVAEFTLTPLLLSQANG